MPRVIDTSVVVKWAVEEPGSEIARELIGDAFIAPDLLQAELAHALSRRSRAGEFTAMHALASQALIESAVAFVQTGPFSRRALELSLELGHPAADCFFLAVAEAGELVFLTADKAFVAKCRATSYANLVESLS